MRQRPRRAHRPAARAQLTTQLPPPHATVGPISTSGTRCSDAWPSSGVSVALGRMPLVAYAGAPANGPMAAERHLRRFRLGCWVLGRGRFRGWFPYRVRRGGGLGCCCHSLLMAGLTHGAQAVHLAHGRFTCPSLSPVPQCSRQAQPKHPLAHRRQCAHAERRALAANDFVDAWEQLSTYFVCGFCCRRCVPPKGFLDGYAGSIQVRHQPRSEVLASVGFEMP
jgi:hypothetical protein